MNYRRLAVALLLLVQATASYAQSCSKEELKSPQGQQAHSLRNLFVRNPKSDLHLCFDMRSVHVIVPHSPMQIGNGSAVEIKVYRNPVDKCVMTYNPTPIAPPGNPIAAVIGSLITGKPLTPSFTEVLPTSVCDTPL